MPLQLRVMRASSIHGLAGMAAIMASTYKAYMGEGLGGFGKWLLQFKIPHFGRVLTILSHTAHTSQHASFLFNTKAHIVLLQSLRIIYRPPALTQVCSQYVSTVVANADCVWPWLCIHTSCTLHFVSQPSSRRICQGSICCKTIPYVARQHGTFQYVCVCV